MHSSFETFFTCFLYVIEKVFVFVSRGKEVEGERRFASTFCYRSSNLLFNLEILQDLYLYLRSVESLYNLCIFSKLSFHHFMENSIHQTLVVLVCSRFYFVTKLPCLFIRIFLAVCYNLRTTTSCIFNMLA